MKTVWLWVAAAGAAGTLARWWLSFFVNRLAESVYPWGTTAVNIVGCLAFGLCWSLLESRYLISPTVRMAVFMGFFGAFTTFSTFAFETSQLLLDGQWLHAAANILFQNTAGILAMLAGLMVARWVS